MMIFIRRNLIKTALFLFTAVITVGVTKAETIFSADFEEAQTVPANNSAGTGFGFIVLNDAEDEIRFIAEFSGLNSNNSGGFVKLGAVGQNGFAILGVGFASNSGTSGTAFQAIYKITPAEVQQLRNGQWYFSINSVNFPNGELRGQILPYSPYVAQLNRRQNRTGGFYIHNAEYRHLVGCGKRSGHF